MISPPTYHCHHLEIADMQLQMQFTTHFGDNFLVIRIITDRIKEGKRKGVGDNHYHNMVRKLGDIFSIRATFPMIYSMY